MVDDRAGFSWASNATVVRLVLTRMRLNGMVSVDLGWSSYCCIALGV